MPVDLSTIPTPAQRSSPPSFKRWLFVLTLAVVIFGTATLYFWPANKPTQTAVFWYCFILLPSVVWLSLFALRWLIYTFSDCINDGWDEEREWTLHKEIQRGQRYVNVLAQVAHLPQAMTSASLSMQIIAQEIVLPSTADGLSQQVIRQARFDDIALPVLERLHNRIVALLANSTLHAALIQLPEPRHLTVSLLAETDGYTDNIDLSSLWERVLQTTALPVTASVVQNGGLDMLDKWLDSVISGRVFLVIAVRLVNEQKDGEGDAAVAMLLQTPVSGKHSTGAIARVHRPERSKTAEQLTAAVLQSLHWGNIQPDGIGQIWQTGMGYENQAQSLFSSVDVAFSTVVMPEQTCDIDIHTGLTGKVSPWLTLALATDNARLRQCSQLVMSVPETDSLVPWFTVVHPASGRTVKS
ncbi:Uncharacterised protein [Yersinia intermedia]|nr:Uncharacterised protein [Yersinia intermedia]